ncbi:MAG: NAD-dependent epimerase/dehydratase family protein [Desulfobacteraceae bacterium]|nr:NAD-dependent epimerase/dehydratase family protein [Desulfobacteraceae bacterium]MBU0661739.1 NAD-dependent epimerase/dehydratase family protein [Patescibacteria group bacterium]MBU1932233.1 NAD-dependent epimerase/dehydratase family protein [Patescibacteria group bacterium]
MKIFVTGASSDIGRRSVEYLLSEGCQVICLSRKKTFAIGDAVVVQGDLMNTGGLKRYLENIDMIIHGAGITHTDHPDRYFKINYRATEGLISLAEYKGIKRFVYISTRAVGLEGGAYALSKFLAEESLRRSNLDWVILRVAEVYGTSKEEGIDSLIKLVLRSKVIPIAGRGEYELAPVYVDDVAGVIAKLTRCEQIRRKIYTICGPRTYSINDFISLLCKVYSLDRIRVHVPLFLLEWAVQLKRYLPLPVNLSKDQIKRLLIPKDSDFSAAKRDLGFSPIRIESWLQKRQLVNSEK